MLRKRLLRSSFEVQASPQLQLMLHHAAAEVILSKYNQTHQQALRYDGCAADVWSCGVMLVAAGYLVLLLLAELLNGYQISMLQDAEQLWRAPV